MRQPSTLAMLLTAGLMLGAPCSTHAQAGSDVTVVGPRQPSPDGQAERAYVRALTATPVDGQLARWHQPICVAALGVEPAVATYLREQVERTALVVGAAVAPRSCHPNLVIQFTPDAQSLVRIMERRDPRLLQQVDAAQRARLRMADLPMRWWSTIVTQGADGAPLSSTPPLAISELGGTNLATGAGTRWGNSYNSSLIRTNLRTDLDSVLILVDVPDATGLKLSQVAAIAAFAGLSGGSVPSTTLAVGSVLDLLQPAGDRAGAGLTSGDMAFLTALYRVPADRRAATQRLFLVNAMRSPK